MINVYNPYITKESLKYAHDALDSTWISSQGKYKELVEEKLKEITGVKYVLLLNSGTAAVHLAARYISHTYKGIKNVIVPNNVYVAAWNGFLSENKFNLYPVDANIDTWCMDVKKIPDFDIDNTMILAVHNINSIVNVPSLLKKYPRTIIVEDACEGFLGKYEGKMAGTESLCSCISFFGNKNLTSGEGGALLTNDKYLFDFVKKLHGQGQSNERYIHDEIGYNYRMTNIQAAILYGQIEQLPFIQQEKKCIFELYNELLSDIKEIIPQKPTKGTISSNWMYGVRWVNTPLSYKKIEEYFNENDIEIRPMFYPMSKHKYLRRTSRQNDEVNADILSKECFILPSYPMLKNTEIEYIVHILKKLLTK